MAVRTSGALNEYSNSVTRMCEFTNNSPTVKERDMPSIMRK